MFEFRKIARGYQITIPRSFREKFNIHIGDLIEFVEEDGQLIVKPVKKAGSNNAVLKLLTFLDNADDSIKDMTEDEILKLANEQRKIARKSDASHH
jgi:AbrB family looped-hinge helix DNA binding protein